MNRFLISAMVVSSLALPIAAQAHEATPYGYSTGHYDRRDCDDRYRRHWYRQDAHDRRYYSGSPWSGWRVPYWHPYAWVPPGHASDHRDGSHDRDGDRDWHRDW